MNKTASPTIASSRRPITAASTATAATRPVFDEPPDPSCAAVWGEGNEAGGGLTVSGIGDWGGCAGEGGRLGGGDWGRRPGARLAGLKRPFGLMMRLVADTPQPSYWASEIWVVVGADATTNLHNAAQNTTRSFVNSFCDVWTGDDMGCLLRGTMMATRL